MYFTIENVMQYNRNVNLPQVNVSRVNTALVCLVGSPALSLETRSLRTARRAFHCLHCEMIARAVRKTNAKLIIFTPTPH